MPSFKDRLARANAQARASMAQIQADWQQEQAIQRVRSEEIRDDYRERMDTIKREHRERLNAIRGERSERQSVSDNERQQAEHDAGLTSATTEDAAAAAVEVVSTLPSARVRSEMQEARSGLRERMTSIRDKWRHGSKENQASDRAARLSATDRHGPGRVARMPIVRVVYCRLNEQPRETDGYAYRWPFEGEPAIGDRVFVTAGGSQALEPAVIVAFGRDDYWSGHLKWVRRRATAADYRRSQWLR